MQKQCLFHAVKTQDQEMLAHLWTLFFSSKYCIGVNWLFESGRGFLWFWYSRMKKFAYCVPFPGLPPLWAKHWHKSNKNWHWRETIAFPPKSLLFGFFVSQLVNIDTDKVSGRRAPANALQTLSVTLAPSSPMQSVSTKLTHIVFFLDVLNLSPVTFNPRSLWWWTSKQSGTSEHQCTNTKVSFEMIKYMT